MNALIPSHSVRTFLLRALGLACACVAIAASIAGAQKPVGATSPASAAKVQQSSSDDDDADGGSLFQSGLAGGALNYDGGRSEQALGAVFRWVPVRWFSLSTTPTSVRVHQVASSTLTAASRSGLTDVPVEATVSRGFAAVPWSPSVAGSFGVTLPVGDTASGLGAGEVGSAVSGSLGFSPAEAVWVHLGAGRSLTRFSVQSAFSSGTGWGDASAGVSLSERVGVSAGLSTDLGAVDSTLGRSRSLEGGISAGIGRAGTLNVSGSHGMAGAAPHWSIAIGIGTAFPYLNRPGGSSPNNTLQNSFGGGTHGLSNGHGYGGSSTTGATNPGRGRKP
ncbi:MAG: hypothetical protein ABJA80_00325 [bacterium]